MNLLSLIKIFCLITVSAMLLACAAGDNGSASSEDGASGGVLRAISGTSAIGRPGSWSNNCLAEACVRADNSGNYLLATEVAASALMHSDIPNADGSTTRLYSRYRLTDEITTTMVNINPSTHAILDMWANFSQNQSINLCAEDASCAASLIGSFTEGVEQGIVAQLDAFLADAWPAGRNPFSDIYIAERTDPLDAMHDYLNFVVTSNELIVFNNNDEELARASLNALFRGLAVNDIALTLANYEKAQKFPPQSLSGNAITLAISYSPNQPVEAPAEAMVDVSGSESPNGELTFLHELSTPSGSSETFNGELVTTTLNEGGNNVWVVTATDPTGASLTRGFVIALLGGEDDPATFGAAGSCVTPSEAMDANLLNVCIELQNGSATASCDSITAPSITLIASPAPCAHQVQNEGDLLGICTTLYSETRTFFYENPLRPNYTEIFSEKQARLAAMCGVSLAGDWSTSP